MLEAMSEIDLENGESRLLVHLVLFFLFFIASVCVILMANNDKRLLTHLMFTTALGEIQHGCQ